MLGDAVKRAAEFLGGHALDELKARLRSIFADDSEGPNDPGYGDKDQILLFLIRELRYWKEVHAVVQSLGNAFVSFRCARKLMEGLKNRTIERKDVEALTSPDLLLFYSSFVQRVGNTYREHASDPSYAVPRVFPQDIVDQLERLRDFLIEAEKSIEEMNDAVLIVLHLASKPIPKVVYRPSEEEAVSLLSMMMKLPLLAALTDGIIRELLPIAEAVVLLERKEAAA